MAERHREDAVLALERLHSHDELADRRHGGAVLRDHAAVVARHHWLHLAVDRVGDDRKQLGRALHRVGMRVFLVAHQNVGTVEHQRAQVAVQVELRTDRAFRADDRADPGQQVAFAVVVAVGHHRAMHVDQYGVERQGRLHTGEHLVAKGLVDRAHGRARGRGERGQALDHSPAARLGILAPDMHRRGEVGRLVLRRIAAPDAVLLVAAQAGRKGHELVGLGAEGADEDTLAHALLLKLCDGGSRRCDRRPCPRPA